MTARTARSRHSSPTMAAAASRSSAPISRLSGERRTGRAAPSTGRSTATRRRATAWRCARAGARRSPTGKCSNATARRTGLARRRGAAPVHESQSPASSCAASKPAAPTRSGCIWPPSGIPCWVMRSTGQVSAPSACFCRRKPRRCSRPLADRPFMPISCQSSIPRALKSFGSNRNCRPISPVCVESWRPCRLILAKNKSLPAISPAKGGSRPRRAEVIRGSLPLARLDRVCCGCEMGTFRRRLGERRHQIARRHAGALPWRALSMAQTAALPILSGETGLTRYLEEIRRFPMLEPQEEYMLAKRWREHGDRDAAHRLVTSHLRLVAKIAMGYRGYGLPISEVISEGNVGLMQAVKRFEPEKGFRLATYAMWWIRAAIQEYILRSWSLVKMGTTANQKKLFFNLRKAKSRISALDEGDMRPDQVKLIAKRLGVTEQDVIDMNRRLSGDASLNAPIRDDGEAGEWQDWLVDNSESQESVMAEHEELDNRRKALSAALSVLNDRERRIFQARRLADDPVTLEDLAAEFGVSR